MNPLKKIYCRVFQTAMKIALPVLPYRIPKILNHVDSIIAILNQKDISNVLLVTDKNLRNLNLTQHLEHLLDENNIKITLFKNVQENPSVKNVLEGFELYLDNHCEAIIAFGGGSPIDCAKAIGAKVARPGLLIKEMNGILKILKKTPLLFAIPTTAGTGSETTLSAIITDEKTHQKYTINDFPLIPDYAILDYKLTLNLPPHITAATGMDVLVHIVEAYIGRSRTKYTKKMCIKGLKLFCENILVVYKEPQNIKARKAMQKAAYYAGIAFTRSYVGYVHAISHPISAKYHVPHGLANAIILPHLLEEYGEVIDEKLAKLAKKINLCDKNTSTKQSAEIFKAWILSLNQQLNIPAFVKEIQPQDIDLLAKYADIEANPLYPVPKLFDKKELKVIIEKIKGNKAMTQEKKTLQYDENTTIKTIDIKEILSNQRAFFNSHQTLCVKTRKKLLKNLYQAILKNEDKIKDALYKDLGKCGFESSLCEIGLTLSSLSHTLKNLNKWAKAKKVKTPIAHFPSKSFILQEPYGVALVMSPWNYPFLLTMEPLIGAIAAGNCCVIKPSAYSPFTSNIIKSLIKEVFLPEHVTCITGGREENQALLEERFDYIFFTGSTNIGKLVMEKAAKHLTPVTLELGGKSPCIVEKTANLNVTANRIAFGKGLNASQTCVAPDYLLVDATIKEAFLKALKKSFEKMYTKTPLTNPSYGKMINQKHFKKVVSLIDKNKVIYGGGFDEESLKIEPTILDNVSLNDAVMQEEIFGPLLPVLTFNTISEAKEIIAHFEKPLALYLFTQNKSIEKDVLSTVSFGGGCVNNTIVHLASPELPFGGVGYSGMGRYHGLESFKTFSHTKSILKTKTWIDLPARYQPYQKIYEIAIRFLFR